MNLLIKYGIMSPTVVGYKIKITIPASQIDAALSNWPCRVYLDSTNFDFSKAKPDGTDIYFTDSSDSVLKFERVEYSQANGIGVFDTKVPSVSDSTDTIIYLNTGSKTDLSDAANVWDSNYVMVQHIGVSLTDSTGNGNNGTATGTTVVNTAYGSARSFNGSSGYITLTACLNASEGTMIVLGESLSAGSNKVFIADTGGYFALGHNPASPYNLRCVAYDSAAKTALGTSTYINAYMVATGRYKSGSSVDLIIDGATKFSSAAFNGISDVSKTLLAGKYEASYGKIIVPEIRYSKIARSDAWIKAESLALKNSLLTMEAA